MLHVSATELKNRLGKYLEASQAEPVEVVKSGRPTNVVLSKKTYDELCAVEEQLWDLKSQMAEKEGYLTEKDVRKLFGLNCEPAY